MVPFDILHTVPNSDPMAYSSSSMDAFVGGSPTLAGPSKAVIHLFLQYEYCLFARVVHCTTSSQAKASTFSCPPRALDCKHPGRRDLYFSKPPPYNTRPLEG